MVHHVTSPASLPCVLLSYQAGLGFLVYNGAGTVNLLQSAGTNAVLASAQLGIGMQIFNGGEWQHWLSHGQSLACTTRYGRCTPWC